MILLLTNGRCRNHWKLKGIILCWNVLTFSRWATCIICYFLKIGVTLPAHIIALPILQRDHGRSLNTGMICLTVISFMQEKQHRTESIAMFLHGLTVETPRTIMA